MTALDADVLASFFGHVMAALLMFSILATPVIGIAIEINDAWNQWTARREAAAQLEADQRRYGDDGELR